MPAPPQMPAAGPPPRAWGSPVPEVPPPSDAAVSRPPPVATTNQPAGSDGAPTTTEGTAMAGSVDSGEDEGEEYPAEPTDAADGGTPSTVAPAPSQVSTSPRSQVGAAPAVVGGDWLASVCPYLVSEDGTYRSAAPDEGHRCTAQDPAATLPLAFQERFCLTDRHPRCEMYKFAQETDAGGAIPAAQVPPTDPPTRRTRSSQGGGSNRPVLVAAAGIGGAVVLIVLLVLVMGSCAGDGGAVVEGEATPTPPATERPTATPRPTPEPQVTPTPEPDSDATPALIDEATDFTILYEIQPDEALRKVSDTFGVSRNRLRKINPGLEALTPAELPGTVIEIPITGEMTLAEAQALAGVGYQGIAP